MSVILLIIGLLVIIIAAGAVYFLVMAPSSSGGLHGAGSVSPQVLAILPPNQTKSFSGIMTSVAQNLAQVQKLSIYYQGYAQVGSGFLTFSLPLNVTYERYNTSSRLIFNISKVPLLGNFSAVYVRVNSTSTYSCTTLSGLNMTNSSSSPSKSGYKCMPLRGVSNLFQAFASQNTSASGSIASGASFGSAFNISMRSLGTRYYKSMPCLFITGSGSSSTKTPAGNSNSSYDISMCLSGNYSMPLNFSLIGSVGVNATASTHYAVNLNEVFLGSPLSQAQVASLPGPVVNTT